MVGLGPVQKREKIPFRPTSAPPLSWADFGPTPLGRADLGPISFRPILA